MVVLEGEELHELAACTCMDHTHPCPEVEVLPLVGVGVLLLVRPRNACCLVQLWEVEAEGQRGELVAAEFGVVCEWECHPP